MSLGAVQGEVNCDVCIIGGGFTGLSAGLELVSRGFSVIILEKNTIASSASGRNGGQLLRGFAKSPAELTKAFGTDDAKLMNNLSLEGLALILARISKHEIDCDLKFGHLTTATRKKHITALQREIREWKDAGQDDLQWLTKKETQDIVKSQQYIGGMFDPKSAHFHPLNYALGIAETFQKLGGKIHDRCAAVEIITEQKPKVITEHGVVNARFVIIAGAIPLKGHEAVGRTSIDAAAHMIATEPLGEKRARNLITKDIAVADANFVMNYFRITDDFRLLFGGNCNYNNRNNPDEDQRLRNRMLKVFPSLSMTRIEHCWHGPLNFTINRMPHLGRITPEVYFAHGFGGHGVISTNILGKVLAEAVMGQAERFDVFAKIRHKPLPGSDRLKRPLFVLGMAWYQLRDLL